MSYQVLALKYRPQSFDEVVGQAHVTKTLTNAIATDRMAHALLFTGPRGTGKTTIARILAKAMNCETGPVPTPCNVCTICKSIIDGHCADVFEIDGASNNSVDQIRDLRENVTYLPVSAKFKIYIIDEVHMLSTAAFNALLKTLEEPPEHVMFVFATTEVHKIPATILSRCQRHDLGRIDHDAIAKHLQKLCHKEGFSLDTQSIDMIAMEADGSVRDSLSLLDRVLSSAISSDLSYETVLESLGILNHKILHDIANAVFKKNATALIECVEQADDTGMDLKRFYSDLIVHFRDINILSICGKNHGAVSLPEAEKQIIMDQIHSLSTAWLTDLLHQLLEGEALVRTSSHPKTAVETILIRLLETDPGRQIDQIVSRLDKLAGKKRGSSKTIPPHQAVHPDTMAGPAHPSQAPPQTVMPQKGHNGSWEEFLSKIEKKLPFVHALLCRADVDKMEEAHILIKLENCSIFDQQRLEKKMPELKEMSQKIMGRPLIIQMDKSSLKTDNNHQKQKEKKARQTALNHPLVAEAQKLFNGQIINL